MQLGDLSIRVTTVVQQHPATGKLLVVAGNRHVEFDRLGIRRNWRRDVR